MSANSGSGCGTVVLVSVVLFSLGRACSDDYPADGSSYNEPAVESPEPPSMNGLEFHGYECTVDCSGHQAGYDWADQHAIDDENSCGGNSESFIEGCKAFVQENANTVDEPDEDGGTP